MPSSILETAVEYDPSGSVVANPTLAWTVANPAIATATTPGVTSMITAAGVGTTTFHVADTSRGVVSPDYTIQVLSSLGLVVLPNGVYLEATAPALSGGGSGFAVLGIRMRFLADAMLGAGGGGNALVWIGGSSGAIDVSYSISGGNVSFAGTFNNGLANGAFGSFAQSALPASGRGVILYAVYLGQPTVGATAAAVLLTNDAGTVLFTGSRVGSALGTSGNTDPADTTVRLGYSGNGSLYGGITIDGAEVTSALISTPNTPPLSSDPSAIVDWGFAGVLTPTFGAGTLAPVGGSITYLSGGIWK
jgi:hypothetical protein